MFGSVWYTVRSICLEYILGQKKDAKINLFQFWNTSSPPPDVKILLDGWKQDPDFTYRLYNTETATAYIEKHIGERAVAAFKDCAVPAMQADFFRYCALYHEGGAYVDADTENSFELRAFIGDAERGILMNRQTKIANDFMFVRAPKDVLLRRIIDQAIENIEQKLCNNVWVVTGPSIATKLYADPETKPLFDGFDIQPASVVRLIVKFQGPLEYKSSQDDWRAKLKAGAPSIFNSLLADQKNST